MDIINDQATVQATSVTATVQATVVTVQAMPATTMPVPITPMVQSEEDSEDDLPISKYLRNFLQQEEAPENPQVTEFPQQDESPITAYKKTNS